MDKTTLYWAAPLFNCAERQYCEQLTSILSTRFRVYVPHIDGKLLPDLIGLSAQLARQQIFESDVGAIENCHFLLIVLNGRTVDEGAAFELGVAWSLGKACFGIKDDFRQLVAGGDNLMIECPLQRIFRSSHKLREWVESLPAHSI